MPSTASTLPAGHGKRPQTAALSAGGIEPPRSAALVAHNRRCRFEFTRPTASLANPSVFVSYTITIEARLCLQVNPPGSVAFVAGSCMASGSVAGATGQCFGTCPVTGEACSVIVDRADDVLCHDMGFVLVALGAVLVIIAEKEFDQSHRVLLHRTLQSGFTL